MRTLRVVLGYDGAGFAGSQIQPGVRTVQGELERSWRHGTGLGERVTLAGRTDAGVDAATQVASVRTATALPAAELEELLRGHVPDDLRIVRVEDAPSGFDARRDARWRRYCYVVPPTEARAYADRPAMRGAAAELLGERDFAALSSTGEVGPRGAVRHVLALEIGERRDALAIGVVADAFLRQMVRRFVSALLAVGRGIMGAPELARAVALRDRALLPGPAPAGGLTLVDVGYEEYRE